MYFGNSADYTAYNCSSFSIIGTNRLSCVLPSFVGGSLLFTISFCLAAEPSSCFNITNTRDGASTFFKSPTPSLTQGTLRVYDPPGNHSNPLALDDNLGTILYMGGTGLTNDIDKLQITYGPYRCFPSSECTATEIICTTSPFSTGDHTFMVSVFGQEAGGSDVLRFPPPPLITSIRGCTGTPLYRTRTKIF